MCRTCDWEGRLRTRRSSLEIKRLGRYSAANVSHREAPVGGALPGVTQKRRRLLLVCMTLWAATSAGNGRHDQRDYERKVASARAALIATADPDSLTAAALLSVWLKDGPARSLTLIARAAAEAPDRAGITWLHAQFCAREKSCNPDTVISHLRALDPTNGVAWIDPVSRRATSGTPTSRARLAAVAHAERFDVYLNSIVTHTTSAIIKTKTMDTPSALTSVLGLAVAEAIPAYTQLTNLCKGDALKDLQVLDDCRRLSVVLRRGDTYISEMVGTAIAKRAWAEGDREYQDALSARRTIHYRMAMELKVDVDQLNEEFASSYLELVASHRTEQEVGLAQLIRAGISPDPPDDWKDPHAE